MSVAACPALMVTAPASGQGKTTVTAALARHYVDQGLRVRLFKTGPDFIDPMILERASGQPVYQLDLWMGGEEHCRQLLAEAAEQADLLMIEGVMGLFDGDPCSADLAQRFNLPLLPVIDASAMAQTFGALAKGLAEYRAGLSLAGVFANRVAGAGHFRMLRESLPGDISAFGWLPRSDEFNLPERHLGLFQADEIEDLAQRHQRAAQALQGLPEDLPPTVSFDRPEQELPPRLLDGLRIGLAQDAAFSFVYRANCQLLQAMGAEIIRFSPMIDRELPSVDALYLPGGYPELHLAQLAQNQSMHAAIAEHHALGKPMVAECGGMLYLLRSLSDKEGDRAEMVGLLPGHARLQSGLVNLGLHSASLPEGTLRGHTFHHSRLELSQTPIMHSKPKRDHGHGEAIYRCGRLTASYMHWYFPSNPQAAARLFL